MPRPQTVGQMITFLGMTGFSAGWICDYAIKTAPLRALAHASNSSTLYSNSILSICLLFIKKNTHTFDPLSTAYLFCNC